MKLRIPLTAQLLLCLILNLLLVAALLIGAGGWNTLLTQASRERLAALAGNIADDLADQSESQWPSLLQRYDKEYGVHFSAAHPPAPDGHHSPPSFGAPPGPPPDHGPPPGPSPSGPGHNADRVSLQASGWWGPFHITIPSLVRDHGLRRPTDIGIEAENLPQLTHLLGASRWIGLSLIAFGISVLLWSPLIFGITRAVRLATRATHRIAEGHFDTRLPETRGDELGQLAASVNQMAARLDRLVAGQRQFVADVAHETISPLARMQVGLGLLETRIDPALAPALNDVQEDAVQMAEMLNELLLFSRAGSEATRSPPVAVRLQALVSEAVDRENARDADNRVDASLQVLAHRALLLRAVCNLLRNAQRHAPQSRIEIDAKLQDARVLLHLRDRGPGIAAEALADLGRPFFRPDRSRSRDSGGYGLGLAIVQRCIDACGGQLRFRNREGGGLEVEMELAAVPRQAESPDASRI